MSESPTHIFGVRVAHVEGTARDVQVNRTEVPSPGPIEWSSISREDGLRVREGRGRSGLVYRALRSQSWRVFVQSKANEELEIGSARMQDHALGLAAMWEQAVLSGRIDVG